MIWLFIFLIIFILPIMIMNHFADNEIKMFNDEFDKIMLLYTPITIDKSLPTTFTQICRKLFTRKKLPFDLPKHSLDDWRFYLRNELDAKGYSLDESLKNFLHSQQTSWQHFVNDDLDVLPQIIKKFKLKNDNVYQFIVDIGIFDCHMVNVKNKNTAIIKPMYWMDLCGLVYQYQQNNRQMVRNWKIIVLYYYPEDQYNITFIKNSVILLQNWCRYCDDIEKNTEPKPPTFHMIEFLQRFHKQKIYHDIHYFEREARNKLRTKLSDYLTKIIFDYADYKNPVALNDIDQPD